VRITCRRAPVADCGAPVRVHARTLAFLRALCDVGVACLCYQSHPSHLSQGAGRTQVDRLFRALCGGPGRVLASASARRESPCKLRPAGD
jgi:hypothetical protein